MAHEPWKVAIVALALLLACTPPINAIPAYLTSDASAVNATTNPCAQTDCHTLPGCYIAPSSSLDLGDSVCDLILVNGAHADHVEINATTSISISTGDSDQALVYATQLKLEAPRVMLSVSSSTQSFGNFSAHIKASTEVTLQSFHAADFEVQVEATSVKLLNSGLKANTPQNSPMVDLKSLEPTSVSIEGCEITTSDGPSFLKFDANTASAVVTVSESRLHVASVASLPTSATSTVLLTNSEVTSNFLVQGTSTLASLVARNTSFSAPPSSSASIQEPSSSLSIVSSDFTESAFHHYNFASLSLSGNSVWNHTHFIYCSGAVSSSGTIVALNTKIYRNSATNVFSIAGTPSIVATDWAIQSSVGDVDLPLALTGGGFSSPSNLTIGGLALTQANANVEFNGTLTILRALQPASSADSVAATLRTSSPSSSWTLPSLCSPIFSQLSLVMDAGVFTYNHSDDNCGIERASGGPVWTLPPTLRMLWNSLDEPTLNQTGLVVASAKLSAANETTGCQDVETPPGSDFSASFCEQNGNVYFHIDEVMCPGCIPTQSECLQRRNCTCFDPWTGPTCGDLIIAPAPCSGPPPTPQFTCIGGIWNGIDLDDQANFSVPRGVPIVVQGNFTILGALNFYGPTNVVNVTECLSVGPEGIIIHFTAEDFERAATGKGITIRQSPSCPTSLQSIPVVVKTASTSCSKMTMNKTGTARMLHIAFSIDRRDCSRTGVIVAATCGAVAVAAILAGIGYAIWRWNCAKKEAPKSQ